MKPRRVGTSEWRHTGSAIEWRARCDLCPWRTEPVETAELADLAMRAHVENTHGSEVVDFIADGTPPPEDA